jgi:hypothetical protein
MLSWSVLMQWRDPAELHGIGEYGSHHHWHKGLYKCVIALQTCSVILACPALQSRATSRFDAFCFSKFQSVLACNHCTGQGLPARVVRGEDWSGTARVVRGKDWPRTARAVRGKDWSGTARVVRGKARDRKCQRIDGVQRGVVVEQLTCLTMTAML